MTGLGESRLSGSPSGRFTMGEIGNLIGQAARKLFSSMGIFIV